VEDSLANTGSTLASIIGKFFKLNQEEIRIAIAAGMGSTIGGILRLPFGGAIFSLELLYRRNFNNKLYYFRYYSGLAVFLVYPSGIYYKNKSSVHRGIWSNCCHDRINRNRICEDCSDFSKTFRGHENSTLLKACSRWRNYWNICNRISGNIRYWLRLVTSCSTW